MKDMENAEAFYRERDRRTNEYVGQGTFYNKPIHVEVGCDVITNPAGQLAVLALANQLARVHRRISFSLPAREKLLVPTIVSASNLRTGLMETVNAIDPFGNFSIGERSDDSLVIALGAEVDGSADWFIGADRAIAILSNEPIGFSNYPGTARGAALASCLGAAAMFRMSLGLSTKPRVISAWNYAEADRAEPGPSNLEIIDVGRVLMAGAGAVGASAAFWLRSFGISAADWVILDGDHVAIHNTNRGLIFTPRQAGWRTGIAERKADVVSDFLPGSRSCTDWYHRCHELRDLHFDVILALANDYNVRVHLAHRNAAVSLQATTGENWLSQLHRHITGTDDCIACRTGEIKTPVFGCSTTVVETPTGDKSDASLPFLSAASGLMLATALQRLQAGELEPTSANCWSWDFASDHRMAATPCRFQCADSCSVVWPPSTRRKILAGSRWGHLDPALKEYL